MNKILLTKVTIMCDRIAEMKGNGAINLYHAFRYQNRSKPIGD